MDWSPGIYTGGTSFELIDQNTYHLRMKLVCNFHKPGSFAQLVEHHVQGDISPLQGVVRLLPLIELPVATPSCIDVSTSAEELLNDRNVTLK
jgi:hypothetical protein